MPEYSYSEHSYSGKEKTMVKEICIAYKIQSVYTLQFYIDLTIVIGHTDFVIKRNELAILHTLYNV